MTFYPRKHLARTSLVLIVSSLIVVSVLRRASASSLNTVEDPPFSPRHLKSRIVLLAAGLGGIAGSVVLRHSFNMIPSYYGGLNLVLTSTALNDGFQSRVRKGLALAAAAVAVGWVTSTSFTHGLDAARLGETKFFTANNLTGLVALISEGGISIANAMIAYNKDHNRPKRGRRIAIPSEIWQRLSRVWEHLPRRPQFAPTRLQGNPAR